MLLYDRTLKEVKELIEDIKIEENGSFKSRISRISGSQIDNKYGVLLLGSITRYGQTQQVVLLPKNITNKFKPINLLYPYLKYFGFGSEFEYGEYYIRFNEREDKKDTIINRVADKIIDNYSLILTHYEGSKIRESDGRLMGHEHITIIPITLYFLAIYVSICFKILEDNFLHAFL